MKNCWWNQGVTRLYVIGMVVCPLILFAQDSGNPTKLEEIDNSKLPDSQRLEDYYNLAADYQPTRPDSTILILDKADRILKDFESKGRRVKSPYRFPLVRANAYQRLADFQEARRYFQMALQMAGKEKDREAMVMVAMQYGGFLMDENLDSARLMLHYALDNIDTSLSEQQHRSYIITCYNLSILNSQMYQLDTASAILIRLLDYPQKSIFADYAYGIYNQIGIVLKRKKDYQGAIRYYRKGLDILASESPYRPMFFYNIANVFKSLNSLDSAAHYCRKALDEPIGSHKNRYLTWKLMAEIATEKGSIQDAGVYVDSASVHQKFLDDPVSLAELEFVRGSMHWKTGNFGRAHEAYDQVRKLQQEHATLFNLQDKSILLERWLEATMKVNKEEGLLTGFKEYYTLRDSLETILADEKVQEMVVRFDVREKELENEKLRTDNALHTAIIDRQNAFLVGGIVAVLLLIVLVWFYRRREKEKAIHAQTLEEKNLRIETLLRELNHRVKNNLTFIQSLLEMQGRRADSTDTREALLESENRVRALAMVHHRLVPGAEMTGLSLAAYLKDLTVDLQSALTASGKAIDVRVVCPNDFVISPEDMVRLGLIVNELFTNSVKYAFAGQDVPRVDIEVGQKGDQRLTLFYRDNGAKMLFVHQEKEESLGWKLIRTLVRQMHGEVHILQAGEANVEVKV